MKPGTKLGIGLGLLVVLYLAVLGLGFWRNAPEEPPRTPGWASALEGVSARFAPKLALGRLRCDDQPVASDFKLTETRNRCGIAIPRDGRYDYRKAELNVVPTAVTSELGFYTYAEFDADDFPPDKRDQRCRNEDELRPFRVVVSYAPADGGGDNDWHCWLEEEVTEAFTLTVLEDGGTLTLDCTGCALAGDREVLLRLE